MRSEAGCGGWSGRGGSGGDRKPCRHAACRAAGKACRIGNTASTTSFSIPLSCTFPPVRRTASGIPLASVRTWRFEPGLPQSVRFGPRWRAPLLAVTDALSRAARRKSMALRRPRRSRSACWRRFQTPTSCQSRTLRQHVMPDPQPISWGSISHGTPDCSTKRIPVRTARAAGVADRPSVLAPQAAAAAPPPPKAHQGQGACSCPQNAPNQVSLNALSARTHGVRESNSLSAHENIVQGRLHQPCLIHSSMSCEARTFCVCSQSQPGHVRQCGGVC